MAGKPLHITVAAVPNTEFGNPRILDHDLRLTKASILYADKVKLCSMGAWIAASFYLMGYAPQNEAQQLDMMISLISALESSNQDAARLLPVLHEYSWLFKRSSLTSTKRERHKKNEFKKMLPELWEQFQKILVDITLGFGFDEIELAANEGLLEIHPFSSYINDEVAYEYLSVVEDLLSSTETHPMLDEQTNDLVRSALQEGKISIRNSTSRKSRQIGLVADLFDRLPIFDVRMDELLDLRDELRNPLIRFRAEMVTLSKNIETASWDKDFPSDVQETYQAKIEPALLEIEEQLKSTEFKEFWSRRIVDKYEYLAGGTVTSIALGAAIAPLAGIATGLVAAGIFAKAGLADLKEKTNEIERNGLYFYYRMKKHVAERK